MSIKQIDGYKIKMNECLGKGSYGSVYVGESDTTHKKVAIKVIPKDASTFLIILSRLWRVSEGGSFSIDKNHEICKKPEHRPVCRCHGE